MTQIPAFLISDQREITAINSSHQCWLQSSPYIPQIAPLLPTPPLQSCVRMCCKDNPIANSDRATDSPSPFRTSRLRGRNLAWAFCPLVPVPPHTLALVSSAVYRVLLEYPGTRLIMLRLKQGTKLEDSWINIAPFFCFGY